MSCYLLKKTRWPAPGLVINFGGLCKLNLILNQAVTKSIHYLKNKMPIRGEKRKLSNDKLVV